MPTKSKLAMVLVFCWCLAGTSASASTQDLDAGQDPAAAPTPKSPNPLIEEAFRDLESPYSGERRLAIATLGRELKTPTLLLEKLMAESPRLRAGVAETLGNHFEGKKVVAALFVAFEREKNTLARAAMAKSYLAGAYRSGPVVEEFVRTHFRPALTPAACDFVREEVAQLALSGTRWTDHRKLSRFAALGPYAALGLIPILMGQGPRTSVQVRCLAALAFGRLDSPRFWGRGTKPNLEAPAWTILDGDEDEFPSDLKMALLYASAIQGPDSPQLIQRISKFVREDAFSGHLIESGLYYLYTIPSGAEKGAHSAMQECAREFLGYGYTDRELYNASHLLRRLPSEPLIRESLSQLKEHELSFARYFYFCAAIDNLGEIPEPDRAKWRAKLLDWGLQDGRSPQTRLAAVWYWRDQKGQLPPGIELEKLKEEVRESVRKIHGQQDDADFYAQRAGLLVLPLFKDDQLAALVARMLKHSSEAVRMIAANAAKDAKLTSLQPNLLKIAKTDCEYASFGAATALADMGNRGAIKPLLELIGSGNRNLAPGALIALRKLIGEPASDRRPDSKAGWRKLALSLAKWGQTQD